MTESHPDCPSCKAKAEKAVEDARLIEEYNARAKARRENQKATMLREISERYGMNEDDSYEIYYLWNNYMESW